MVCMEEGINLPHLVQRRNSLVQSKMRQRTGTDKPLEQQQVFDASSMYNVASLNLRRSAP